jgi:hypothetical protein
MRGMRSEGEGGQEDERKRKKGGEGGMKDG